MFTVKTTGILSAVVAIVLAGQLSSPALAQVTYQGYVQHPHHGAAHYKAQSYLYRHPKVRSAAVGAAVGTAAGAVAGLVSHRGVMHGALVGAGTGAGVGLIRSSRTLQRHPILQDGATGIATGLGLSAATHYGHHTMAQGAVVGGALGLGIGALRDVLH